MGFRGRRNFYVTRTLDPPRALKAHGIPRCMISQCTVLSIKPQTFPFQSHNIKPCNPPPSIDPHPSDSILRNTNITMDTIKKTVGSAYEAVSGATAGLTGGTHHTSTPYHISEKEAHAPVAVLDIRTGNETHLSGMSSNKTSCSCAGNQNACTCPPSTCSCNGCAGRNKKNSGPKPGMGVRPIDGKMMSARGGSGACRVMGKGECDCAPGTCAQETGREAGGSSSAMKGQGMMGGMGMGGKMAGGGRNRKGAEDVVLNRDH